MTPEESERVRQTAKARWQQCEDLKGQPRVAVDPKSLSQEVVGADLMADISGPSKDDKMPAIAIGSFYPPCTEALVDLKLMKLSELQMETHHRGRYLSVKCNAPVIQAASYCWTVVEEKSTNEAERLQVFLPTSRLDYILDEGEDFVIKEPYYTLNDQGAPTIRVDHPSDVIIAPVQDDKTSATKWKDLGNAALKKQEYWKAHTCYTHGLVRDASSGESIAKDIHRNRSHVNLILNRFTEARTDGLSAVTGKDDAKSKDLDSKAYFRAGRAAYALEEFEEAKRLFEEQLKISGGDKDAEMFLRKIATRLKEASGEAYGSSVQLRASKKTPRLDAASFTKNTEVRPSHGAGRGLFAAKDFARGEIIFCEKPVCVVWSHEAEAWSAMTYDKRDDRIRAAAAGLRKAIIQKLSNNASLVEKVMDSYGDYEGIGNKLIVTDDEPIVDVFRIHDIVSRNAFGPGPITPDTHEDVRNASTGLWPWAAYVNHSCCFNATKEHAGDLMILRAVRDIKKGEEIFHAYDVHPDHDTRQENLMTTWGFHCACALCKAEESDGAAVRKKRKDCMEDAVTLYNREAETGSFKRLTKSKVEGLAKRIGESYDDGKYTKEMPRLAYTAVYGLVRNMQQARQS